MSRILTIDNPMQGHPLTNQRRLFLELLRDAEGDIGSLNNFTDAPVLDMSVPVQLRCTAMVLMIGACFGN